MSDFDLLLFHRDLTVSTQGLDAGAAGVIVDLESRGKQKRQLGFDTEINSHTVKDLAALRRLTKGHLLCRISQPDPDDREIGAVIDAGADEIIVPMLTDAAQIERLLRKVDGVCQIMAMIETQAATVEIEKIAALPVDRIYVGLNDLQIDRGTRTIFAPLADGLMQGLRARCKGRAFGFGGLTLPGYGDPLPSRSFYGELARLDCRFTFLRRSFYRDLNGMDLAEALHIMQANISRYRNRSADQSAQDTAETVSAIMSLEGARCVG